MGNIIEYFISVYSKFGPAIFVPIVLGIIVGVGGQWMLYEKCKLKGIASIVPVWNVIEFLKIMGRPAWQAIVVIVPPPIILLALMQDPPSTMLYSFIGLLSIVWLVFIVKVYIDLCNCFGRKSILDYIFAIVFNGLYVLSLGLSYDAKYLGPNYKQKENIELV